MIRFKSIPIARHPVSLAILSAILCTLLFPDTNHYWFIPICLIPLCHAISLTKTVRESMLIGWIFGSIFMGLFHTWIFEVRAFAPIGAVVCIWLICTLYMGGFYAVSLGLTKKLFPHTIHPIGFASIWVISEWLRSLGPVGNTAGTLAYSITNIPIALPLAAWIGPYGISALIVLINAGLFLKGASPLLNPKKLSIPIAVILTGLAGFIPLTKSIDTSNPSAIKVTVIQPNHSQSKKLHTPNDFMLVQDLLIQSRIAANRFQPQLIVWPETVTTALNLQNPLFIHNVRSLAQEINGTIVFGTPEKDYRKYYNAIATISSDPAHNQLYKKQQLMPFGEYWPFKSVLRRIGLGDLVPHADYSPGKEETLLAIQDHIAGSGICLESIYPAHFRKSTQQGAEFFIMVANNAWFFNSSAAAKLRQMAQLRCAENNRYAVLSANTGISAIIHANGQLISQSALNTKSILTGTIIPQSQKTPYTRWGNGIILLLLIASLLEKKFNAQKIKPVPSPPPKIPGSTPSSVE